MPDASYLQSNFLGGEWGISAQGRIDHPAYSTAMALCQNAYPIEEGACARRPGFAFCGTTRNGQTAKILPFNVTDLGGFEIEVTNGALRMWQGRGLCYDSVSPVLSFSAATPSVMAVPNALTWNNGDQIQFLFNSTTRADYAAILRDRTFVVTKVGVTGQLWSLTDAITGAGLVGTQVNFSPDQVSLQAAHIATMTVPYATADLPNIRRVQAANLGPTNLNVALLLNAKYQPQLLQAVIQKTALNLSTFSCAAMDFHDGPYFDPVVGAVMTPNAVSGTIQLTLTYQTWSSSQAYGLGDFVSFSGSAYVSLSETNINNQPNVSPSSWSVVNAGGAVGTNGFQNTDVGRQIRLLSEPAAWNNATVYTAGQTVKYNSAYYIAVIGNSALEPDQNLAQWLPTVSPSVYTWTWGKIVSVVSSNVVNIQLFGGNLLYTQPILTWRIGLYSNSTGWPSCGVYHEGRLWLAGAMPNRIDASNSNDFFNFAPTAGDGSVGDSNAISAVFNSDDSNNIYWLDTISQGIAAGTKDGEWLIQASNLNDPITPTTIQAKRHTKVGCANQQPAKTPLTLVFIAKANRLLFELFPDVFSGKMTAPNLNQFSKHLATTGVQELAYTAELTPILWARMGDGTLKGWTYRRQSAFASEEPKFVGGHRHVLGAGRTVESICVAPSPDQTYDSLYAVTTDLTGVRHLWSSTKLMDDNSALTAAMFLDAAVSPSGVVAGTTGATFYGLWHLNGQTATVTCGGLDLGDYTVSNGNVFVPWQSDPGKFFTYTFLQSLNGGSYGDFATSVYQSATIPPATSSGQSIQQWLFPTTNVTGQGSDNVQAYWPGPAAVFVASGGIAGLRNVNIVTGKEIAEVSFTTLNANPTIASLSPHLAVTSNFYMGTDGFLYAQPIFSNSDPIYKINPTNWSVAGAFGTDNNGFTVSAAGFPFLWGMVQVTVAGVNYLVCAPALSAFTFGFAVLNSDTMTYLPGSGFGGATYYGPAAVNSSVTLIAGHYANDYGTVYGLGTMYPNSNMTSTGFYEITITPQSTGPAQWTARLVLFLTPTMIDPQWHNFSFISGPMRDPVDGNIIAVFGTNDPAVQTPARIVKLSTVDGSVIWNSVISGGVSDIPSAGSMLNSRTTGGVYAWLGAGISPANVYNVNLETGQINTAQINGVSSNGHLQLFDAVTGTMALNVAGYNALIGGAPQPLPGTPNSFTGWGKLGLGSVYQAPSSSTQSGGIPAAVGYTYTTQGQGLRKIHQQETGAANGPAVAKTRRSHMFGVILAAAVYGAVSFGTKFSKLRGAYFKSDGGHNFATNQLFSGIYWHTLEDGYSFDSQIGWQVTRPLPATVAAITGFLTTQDR